MLAAVLSLPTILILAALGAAPAQREPLKVARSRSYPLAWPAVDVAVLDDGRFLLLAPTRVLLARLGHEGLVALSELPLPGPFRVVRAPAGMIRMSDDRSSCWLLTNLAHGALLVAIEDDRLVSRLQGDALPWLESSTGVSFQEGTNLLKASIELLGEGPFMSLAPIGQGLGVMNDGRLKIAAPDGGRLVDGVVVGPTLAPLLKGRVASSTARPPGASDEILILSPEDAGLKVTQSIPIEHSVRALGSRAEETMAVLAVLTEAPDGSRRLHVLELRNTSNR